MPVSEERRAKEFEPIPISNQEPLYALQQKSDMTLTLANSYKVSSIFYTLNLYPPTTLWVGWPFKERLIRQ